MRVLKVAALAGGVEIIDAALEWTKVAATFL